MWNENEMRYLIYQGEKCPQTSREHWQGYVELHRPLNMQQVKDLLGHQKCHLEPRRGSKAQARDYCRKLESRVIPPVEHGNTADENNTRRTKDQELEEIVRDVKRGHGPLDIDDILVAKHYKSIEYLQRRELEKNARYRSREVRVLVL